MPRLSAINVKSHHNLDTFAVARQNVTSVFWIVNVIPDVGDLHTWYFVVIYF